MRHTPLLVALLAGLGLAGQAHAITDSVINAGLQLSFSNPGARSLGMGGAFLGFSDDATAAYTNPAGLTILAAPEIALEGRRYENSVSYASGGSASVAPNSSSGLTFADAESHENTLPSFISMVYPTEVATFAVYRHVLADYNNQLLQNTITVNSADPELQATIFGQAALIRLNIDNIGASAGFRLNDQWSFGISALYSQIDTFGVTARLEGQSEGQFGKDEDWVYNLGLLYRLNDQWSFGMAYRHGASFDLNYATIDAETSAVTSTGLTGFDVPHQLGIGVAWRPSEALAIGFEANRVEYSRLGKGFNSIAFSFPDTDPGFELTADNGVELRLGAEYVFTNMNRPFTVRAGVWRDPDHRIAYRGPTTPVNFGAGGASVLFPEGDDEMHYSLGFGWVFDNFQVDAGADVSDLTDIYSVSGVYRF